MAALSHINQGALRYGAWNEIISDRTRLDNDICVLTPIDSCPRILTITQIERYGTDTGVPMTR